MNLEKSLNISWVRNIAKENRLLEFARGEEDMKEFSEGKKQITAHVLLPGEFGGNHYHKKKLEKMYVILGPIIVTIENPATRERCQKEISVGQEFTLVPSIAHIITNLSDTTTVAFLETATLAFDPEDSKKDVYPYEVLALKKY